MGPLSVSSGITFLRTMEELNLVARAIDMYEHVTGDLVDPRVALSHEGAVKVTLHRLLDELYVTISHMYWLHRYVFTSENGLSGPYPIGAQS